MYEVTFFAPSLEPETITVETLSTVMAIVYSGANVMVVSPSSKEWRDACGGEWVTKWAPLDKPAELSL